MKSAGIYKLNDEYKIHSLSQTVDGFSVASPPFSVVAVGAGPMEIANKIFDSLKQSKTDVPNPTNWKEFQKTFLSSIKVKTLKQLHENASYCLLEEDGKTIRIVPHKRLGLKDGFDPREDKAISFASTDSREAVAKKIIETLETEF